MTRIKPVLPSRRTKFPASELNFAGLPWIPKDLAGSLSAITAFLVEAYASEISRVGLYGSWQRGDPGPGSDVDIVVFLNHDVAWFDPDNGVVDRLAARRDRLHWHGIEKKANARRLDKRDYSIVVVTRGMLDYYSSRGPIHLQNWVYALKNCHPLWDG